MSQKQIEDDRRSSRPRTTTPVPGWPLPTLGKLRGVQVYHCDTFVLPLPEKHRFPMKKYEQLRLAVSGCEMLSSQVSLCLPPAATDQQLTLVHCPDYLNALKTGQLDRKVERSIGFPYSPALLERSRRSVGATLAACRSALKSKVAVNLAGGTHHAFHDRGEGFCVFNDSAVAIRTLQSERLIDRALVIDTDVHQGNGTAAIFGQDDSVYTFSIHGAKNFPFRKETSDLDVALPDETDDETYLDALEIALSKLQNVPSDVIIFQSGADPYLGDKLGRLSLSKEGLRERDRLVLSWIAQRHVPVAVTMGGGYAPRVEDIVDIHLETVREAYRSYCGQS
jgi:acetoin utilization deacetylase AcuC-like enzyme